MPRCKPCRVAAACLVLVAMGTGCKAKIPVISEPFSDTFDRAELGPMWLDTGGGFRIADNKLNVKGAYNHPLWLRRRLPADVMIEFDAMSKSPSGDIKFELFGDGESFDPDRGSYQPTGYVLIFGGWQNSLSVICKLDEHGAGQKVSRADIRVEPGRTYRFSVSRTGGHIQWKIDGQPFLDWKDPEPLSGVRNEFLAFNNWDADVTFENLSIRPITGGGGS
jgi:hypothetical protein